LIIKQLRRYHPSKFSTTAYQNHAPPSLLRRIHDTLKVLEKPLAEHGVLAVFVHIVLPFF
jgi:hypothetical protein